MKRIVCTLAVIAAMFAIALPAQAGTYQRVRLGTSVSQAEQAAFGCNYDLTRVEPAALLIRSPHGRYSIAKVGTVKHQHRIVGVCLWAHPHAPRTAPPTPRQCPLLAECAKP